MAFKVQKAQCAWVSGVCVCVCVCVRACGKVR